MAVGEVVGASVQTELAAASGIRSSLQLGGSRRVLRSDLACPDAAATLDLLLTTLAEAGDAVTEQGVLLGACVEALTCGLVLADSTDGEAHASPSGGVVAAV